jgi:peptidoglycan/xylan/chitin deacetylase (PgdA/CDA1 family)
MTIEVALTFDDLPGVNPPVITHIIKTVAAHQIQGVYGFCNGLTLGLDATFQNIFDEWIAAGNFLANHTYSHLNLSQASSLEYINDINKNNILLEKFTSERKKYFRYPYLDEGDTHEKRNQVREYLISHQYQIVPATIYIEEYRWNTTFTNCVLSNDQPGLTLLKDNLVKHAVEMLRIASGYSHLLFGREIKHILLLHETLFNAYILDDVITAFKNAGVKFISLPEALTDEIYQINPNVLGVEYYGILGQLREARKLKLTEKLRTGTMNFIKRYSDSFCSFTD